MSSSTSDENMITLRSSDGEIFELDVNAAVLSGLLNRMIEDGSADNVIPLLNVTGKILSKVTEYCMRHVEPEGEDELEAFDAEFVNVDQVTLFDIILAANYMDVKGLLDLTCRTVADMIKGKTPEESVNFSTLGMIILHRKKRKFAGRTLGLLSDFISIYGIL